MLEMAKWIQAGEEISSVPAFVKRFTGRGGLREATLTITSLGVYEAFLNGKRVGEFVLAPGWTSYENRLQVQSYRVEDLLVEGENELCVWVGKGWYASPLAGWLDTPEKRERAKRKPALLASLSLYYADGSREKVSTGEDWLCKDSPVRFSEIYDGECFDASLPEGELYPCQVFEGPRRNLIPQEGEEIREMEVVEAKKVFTTPKGEVLIDFGQEVTGYVEFSVEAKAGDTVHLLFGEVLDKEGNFYRENYRSAKAELTYTCKDGKQTYHPHLTFYGFRYAKVLSFPGEVKPEQFVARVVYSQMKRTAQVRCGVAKLNRLFSNIFWGQKGNYLDVPTDCPQRDERLGWTGDAQAFVKAASYNFDVERFFFKWLADLSADQFPDGGVGSVIPCILPDAPSAAWGDAAVICPWQIYQTYGDPEILSRQFFSMKAWVDYIGRASKDACLWTGGVHFGDWLGLDAPQGSYKGSSREDLIASAFYFHSVELLVKAGKVLGKDMSCYEELGEKIKAAFQKAFPEYFTQTEMVLALYFHLTPHAKETASALAEKILQHGTAMETGFVGTPYLLHALSENGYGELAWSLLLREEYPSWLYSVNKGATTVWEHWDGIMENGEFWSSDMNSFNHYAYGAVIDWVYEKAAGLAHAEEDAGFTGLVYAPCPDRRIGFLEVTFDSRHGRFVSKWVYTEEGLRYELTTPVEAVIRLPGQAEQRVLPGSYVFWGAGE